MFGVDKRIGRHLCIVAEELCVGVESEVSEES